MLPRQLFYGSRGANGVILITTKRAKAGEAKVTVDIKLGSIRVLSRITTISKIPRSTMKHTSELLRITLFLVATLTRRLMYGLLTT